MAARVDGASGWQVSVHNTAACHAGIGNGYHPDLHLDLQHL